MIGEYTLPELETLKLFVLVMVRFSGLMVSAPVLGSRNFPIMAKIGLVALMAMLITPMVEIRGGMLPKDGTSLAVLGAGDLLIGLMIGFVMTIVFAAIQVGGQIMDMQTGFGMMNVFNPASETQFPIFGFFYFILAVLYLLAMDGHHVMIRALVASYDHIPVGGFVANPKLLFEVSTWGRSMFVDGLIMAAPVAGAMMLAYISMGLLGRVVPQIHLFAVGFPITIATGLIVVALSIDMYLGLLDDAFRRMFEDVTVLIRGLG